MSGNGSKIQVKIEVGRIREYNTGCAEPAVLNRYEIIVCMQCSVVV